MRTLATRGRQLFGVLLLLLPFIPLYSLSGESVDLKYAFSPYQWLLSIFIVVAVSWLLALILPRWCEAVPGLISGFARFCRRYFAVLSIVLGTVACGYCFDFKPHLIDVIVQLLQSTFFASGMLAAPAPLLPAFFVTQHMLIDGGQWYAQYAPIHSMLLALGDLVGAPWLISVGSATLGGWLLVDSTRRLYDQQHANLVALFLLVSCFFVAMSGSMMNHVTSFLWMAWAFNLFLRWHSGPSLARVFMIGILVGLGAATRSLEFVAVAPLAALLMFPAMVHRREFAAIVAGCVGTAIGVAPYLYYNLHTTGDPFLPGFIKLWGTGHDIGFHLSPWGEEHTPLAGIIKQIINLGLLHEYLFESLVPALLPLGVFLVWARKLTWSDRVLFVGFCTQPLAYVFYWHRDSFLGPRYLFVALVFLLPLLARSMMWVGSQHFFRKLGNVEWRHLLSALLLVNLAYLLFVGAPTRLTIYHSGLKSFKQDIVAEAKQQGIEAGILFVPVSYGARIISNLRELKVPAWLIEQVYRSTDHCELGARTRAFLTAGSPPDQVIEQLHALMAVSRPITKVRVNQDKTFRMYADRLQQIPEQCLEEIRYDNLGYTLVEPHLLHNDPRLQGDLIIARDLRERNVELARLYPAAASYLYRKGTFVPLTLGDKR